MISNPPTKYTDAEALAAAIAGAKIGDFLEDTLANINAKVSDATLVDSPAEVQSGHIGFWHGTIANIPAGYVICDGNNSTPNLLTRFIEGVATAATNPGATGGATAKTTSGHQHDLPITEDARHCGWSEYGAGANFTRLDTYDNVTIRNGGSYAGVLDSSETDSITDIRPKYYDAAFIMKT